MFDYCTRGYLPGPTLCFFKHMLRNMAYVLGRQCVDGSVWLVRREGVSNFDIPLLGSFTLFLVSDKLAAGGWGGVRLTTSCLLAQKTHLHATDATWMAHLHATLQGLVWLL